MYCDRTKVSKNHVVCAKCHFAGLASGIGCKAWSSTESGEHRCSDMSRIRSTFAAENLPADKLEISDEPQHLHCS